MTAATNRRSRAIDIAALRTAADLLENPISDDIEEITPFRQVIFYTADEAAADLGLDLFDDPTLTELTDRVRGLIEHLAS